MSIRNTHWYSLNASRSYPVDETASCLSDEGERLPEDILIDLRLRWSRYLGQYAFLSAVSVTPYAVSLTFQADDVFEGSEAVAPLAAVTVPLLGLQEGRAYAVTPFVPGVYGYVAFGGGVGRPYTGRFSSPAQAWLAPRAARPCTFSSISGVRTINSGTPLTGVIRLRGQHPIEVVAESREIGGEEQDVIVVRLVGDPQSPENVFESFAGPCGKRPESRNCGDPQPIEYINAVAPDGNGVLTLEFKGPAFVGQTIQGNTGDDAGGIVIDCPLGLHDACVPPYLPDREGHLPVEFDPTILSAADSESDSEPLSELDESIQVLGELPYLECFRDGVADQFAVKSGEFQFEEEETRPPCFDVDDSGDVIYDRYYTYCPIKYDVPNLSVWEGFDVSTLYREYGIQFMLKTLDDHPNQYSGGLVINYRPHNTIPNHHVYYFAAIEKTRLVLYFFDGFKFHILAQAAMTGTPDVWYNLVVRTLVVRHQAVLRVSAALTTGGTPLAALPDIVAHNYAPDTGACGVGSYHGVSRFASFRVAVFDPYG